MKKIYPVAIKACQMHVANKKSEKEVLKKVAITKKYIIASDSFTILRVKNDGAKSTKTKGFPKIDESKVFKRGDCSLTTIYLNPKYLLRMAESLKKLSRVDDSVFKKVKIQVFGEYEPIVFSLSDREYVEYAIGAIMPIKN